MSEPPKPQREPLEYETLTRPADSTEAFVGAFFACMLCAPMAAIALTFGLHALIAGEALGFVGLLIGAIVSAGVWGFAYDQRSAGLAGTITGMGLLAIVVRLSLGQL